MLDEPCGCSASVVNVTFVRRAPSTCTRGGAMFAREGARHETRNDSPENAGPGCVCCLSNATYQQSAEVIVRAAPMP